MCDISVTKFKLLLLFYAYISSIIQRSRPFRIVLLGPSLAYNPVTLVPRLILPGRQNGILRTRRDRATGYSTQPG